VHDYIHVADVSRANVMAMASEVTAESFNVATGVATSLNRIVELLVEITGTKLKPVYKSGGSHVRASVTQQLDFSRAKIEKMVGWRPEVSIEEGIRRLIAWREREDAAARNRAG
jgi:UDP-glucose 4-epimerase